MHESEAACICANAASWTIPAEHLQLRSGKAPHPRVKNVLLFTSSGKLLLEWLRDREG